MTPAAEGPRSHLLPFSGSSCSKCPPAGVKVGPRGNPFPHDSRQGANHDVYASPAGRADRRHIPRGRLLARPALLGSGRPRRLRPRRPRRRHPDPPRVRGARFYRAHDHHGLHAGVGRHGHWRRLDRAADRPVRSAQEPDHLRRRVLALHNRDRPSRRALASSRPSVSWPGSASAAVCRRHSRS